MFRADRAKDVGRFRPLVLGCRWPGPASRPAPRDLVLLDDTGFVLEPDLYQGLVAALGGPSRSNLIEASYRSCGRLGIAQGTWGRACQQFGRERAALCVLLIDRNVELPGDHRYKARSPSRCLSGMMRKERSQGFNLTGLFRAGQHDQHFAERVGRKVPTQELHLSAEDTGNGALGLFTNNLLTRLGAQFEGGAA